MSIETIEGINERRRAKTLRRQIARYARGIRTHADLERILRKILDDTKRREFFECIKPFLRFKVESGPTANRGDSTCQQRSRPVPAERYRR